MDETLYPPKSTILEPSVKLLPVLEENPATEEPPVLEENPATEEPPVLEENPVTEEPPKELPPVILEKKPATEEVPVKVPPVILEKKPATEEVPVKLPPVLHGGVTEELLSKLRLQCKDLVINKTTIAVIIKYVIEAVEDTPVKGAAQKEYALRLLRALIEELSQGEDKEYLLNSIDSGSIGDIIELIVSASKGEININKVIKTSSTLLPYCMALLGKCVNKPKK